MKTKEDIRGSYMSIFSSTAIACLMGIVYIIRDLFTGNVNCNVIMLVALLILGFLCSKTVYCCWKAKS